MKERSILIVDDDEISRELLIRYLRNHGLNVIAASNGREGLELFERNPVPVVITDLYMPDLDGRGLVQGLAATNPPPVILMQTVEQDAATAVEMMREGVHDYIIKPIRERELIFRVDRALEYYESQRTLEALEQERRMRLDRQLNWNVWKEAVASRDSDRYDSSLFQNLRVCFTQGAGFGGLVALAELMEGVAQKQDGFYMIPEEIMTEILSNAATARRTLEEFRELDTILNAEIALEPTSFEQFFKMQQELLREMQALATIKQQTIKQGTPTPPATGGHLLMHGTYLQRALRELLVNACKFSDEKSEILLLYKTAGSKFLITVLNKPGATVNLAVPGFEHALFEPFLRFGSTVDERYGTLDYGLGLTQAEKIVRSHRGRLTASHVRFHLENDEAFRLNMEVELPIVKGDET